MYDIDIAIIGAGPAGLSAAIRARWVKTALAIPASVVLLDPAGIGGIARLGRVNLTGPSFGFSGSDLIKRLQADIDAMEIPLLREAAIAVRRDGDYWEVETPHRMLRCLAVVLATGLRCLAQEPELHAKGHVRFLSGSYARAYEVFGKWSTAHQGNRALMIGSEELRGAVKAFAAQDLGHNHIEAICEPRQQVVSMEEAGDRLQVTIEEAGRRVSIPCDIIFLDYHSLETTPPALAFLDADLRTPMGFAIAGPEGHPDLPGLFAAGDCARPPSACLKALAQGSEAGFQAYNYTYQQKFGASPDLFAFYPSAERPAPDAAPLPFLDARQYIAVGLTAKSRFSPPPFIETLPLWEAPENPATLAMLNEEVIAKIATVHKR